MSIMDLFRQAPAAQDQQPAQQPTNPNIDPSTQNPNAAQPGNIPNQVQGTKQTAKTAANGTVPGGAENEGNKEPASPMEKYTDLWDDAKDDKNTQNPGTQNTGPDLTKVMEAAGKVDFSRVVTPEVLKQIEAGGSEGVQASIQAMNKMVQSVYGQSAMATAKIVEAKVKEVTDNFNAKLPEIIRKATAKDSLRGEDPRLSNPAVAPIISAVQERLAVKHPNASSKELNEMAKDYVTQFASVFSPDPAAAASSGKDGKNAKKGETDWSTFL